MSVTVFLFLEFFCGSIMAEPCSAESSDLTTFSSLQATDTLRVVVDGEHCAEAKVVITVSSAEGELLYHYDGKFIDHMPYMIMEPELNKLVNFFTEKVVNGAVIRTTKDLPEYSNEDDYYESTNDIVEIPIAQYNELRSLDLPILWHITGESTWVHLIYDADTAYAKVIMRGGVFR
jgi:hypothetical protein